MDVTSAFQGITTPLTQLYDEIHRRGWQVKKVNLSGGQYIARVENPYGETIEKQGRDPSTALAACLAHIVRKEYVRQANWSTTFTERLDEIAQEYAKAPVFEPKAALAWKELADDCYARAQVLGQQLKVEVVDDPEPYMSADDMAEDVRKKKKIKVSRANPIHPVWTEDQVIAFRLCFDVLGRCAAGGNWGWAGTNIAFAAYAPLVSENTQKALFTETVGRSAYATYFAGYGPPKVAFLKIVEKAQKDENAPGHSGTHPGESLAPGSVPEALTGIVSSNVQVQRDPNYGYDTAINPGNPNAFLHYGDPLDYQGVKDVAQKLDTGWKDWETPEGEPDRARIKQAIVNGFRAALLSPMKELKWNAAHYQDISHIPADTADPKVYWDALENARIEHNRGQGVPNPEIQHKKHYQSLLDFYRYYAALHPGMTPQDVKKYADREVQVMQQEIEQRLMSESKSPDMEIFEPRVFAILDKRLKDIVKDEKPIVTASEGQSRGLYGGFIGRHLSAIAKISQYSDVLTDAALEDVKEHDGTGHHFRATALGLGIPNVGPKIVSFVWLLLSPLTSQLATIDTHMADTLGYRYDTALGSKNVRDYFRLERELQAGRDASGYGFMPLGQFQWGLWDLKRSGPGTHQDHSPLRPWNPQDWRTVDWHNIAAPRAKGDQWVAPEWWQLTEPDRQSEAARWMNDVAPFYPRQQIPWSAHDAPTGTMVEAGSHDEIRIALKVPEPIKRRIRAWLEANGIEPADDLDIPLAYGEHGLTPQIERIARDLNLDGIRFRAAGMEVENGLTMVLDSPEFQQWARTVNARLAKAGARVNVYAPKIRISRERVLPEYMPALCFRAQRQIVRHPRGKPQEVACGV